MELNRAIIEAAIVGFEKQKEQIDNTIAELRSQLDGGSVKPDQRAGNRRVVRARSRRRTSDGSRS